MHRLCVALRCVLVLFCLSTPALAQSSGQVAGLSGVVSAEDGNQPISNASVRLCNDGQSSFQEVVTGDSGEFTFAGLHPGRYTLQIRAAGFDPIDQQVDLSSAFERGHSILLKRTKTAQQEASAGPSISAHELSMPEAARKLVASGKRKFYGEKNPQEGLNDFQSAVTKAPNYYEAYHQIGLVYLALKNLADAEKNLRKSVELSHGEFPDADIALGALLADHGDPVGGEPLLRHGLELYPRSWIGLYELATIALSRGHLEAARQSAQQAESLAPTQPLPHRLLAIIHLKEKNYPELLEELDAFIAIDPDSPAGLRAKELRAQTQKTLDAAPSSDVAVNKPH
jgi:tetratricopeptide (TPR) repeat protein